MDALELVLIEFENHCLLCRKEGCYETMLSLYAEMSVRLVCTPLCSCTFDEYSFIIDTLGGRAHQRQKSEEVRGYISKIVEFYRIKKRLSNAALPERWRGQPSSRKQASGCWVFYNVLTKKSVVSGCLDVASFYPEFAVVDCVPDTPEARSFFHNKAWKDRERLLQKVLAFGVLFS